MLLQLPICWIDKETTGLWPDQGHLPLEIAFIVTDSGLNELVSGVHLIRQDPATALGLMDDFVRDMHKESGLIDCLGEGEPAEIVEQKVIDAIRSVTNERPVAAGNSLSLDRNFMHAFMPQLNDEVLSYRSIDVSSLGELARRWNPVSYDSKPEKASRHRALDDIRESIEELRHYRKTFLKIQNEA